MPLPLPRRRVVSRTRAEGVALVRALDADLLTRDLVRIDVAAQALAVGRQNLRTLARTGNVEARGKNGDVRPGGSCLALAEVRRIATAMRYDPDDVEARARALARHERTGS